MQSTISFKKIREIRLDKIGVKIKKVLSEILLIAQWLRKFKKISN